MSSPPQETETQDIELSREEQWVVHDVVTQCADKHLDTDADTEPPGWLLELFDTIEADEHVLTVTQSRKLHELLTSYADADDTVAVDTEHANAIVDRLEIS